MKRDVLVISSRPSPAPGIPADPAEIIHLRPEAGLGGIYTEYDGSLERVRLGYPARAASRWFRIDRTGRGRHNALSLAIERIVYARGITRVFLEDEALAGTVRHALRLFGATVTLTGTAGGRSG